MTKKITLTFAPNGSCKVEAEGYEGGTCLDATKVFEDMYDAGHETRKMTGECVQNTKEKVYNV